MYAHNSRKATTRFLKPEVVAKLKSIDLKARLVVEGFLAGLHRSPYKGFSVEFAEHRPYMPGDEPKRIDWRVYAKTDRFFVREYEEETNLRAYIILDSSGSMGYKTGGITKLEYACYLAASLAYLLLHQKDSAGLVVFSDRIDTYIPARSSPAHLNVLLSQLNKLRPGGDTNLAGTFHQLAERIKRRGLIIILSDLWDDRARVLSALRHFRHRKHEVLVFHILDPNEQKFTYRSPVVLKDMETGQDMTIDPRVVRTEYRASFEAFFRQFERGCREGLIDYHLLTTDTPFDRALLSYLARRQRLR
ncbi:DUF58 domain-containing protein [candidate division WOR-3 bacterium JGI_Cruoil_03_51_56]|mgnify:CR=1 FL=1|uniref:DUF58 domain-containing protein n=1 Tax=candidate division WOR-3 bacterium JGI_Cruoil_03_51_56 TaxID=1973747 RepID=A0A235BRF7_UNCW3|nr:MAG: DUF58 domain-containing protein [candidate division WOR-3 bacterium JGI_Cruoil_03_51_56]